MTDASKHRGAAMSEPAVKRYSSRYSSRVVPSRISSAAGVGAALGHSPKGTEIHLPVGVEDLWNVGTHRGDVRQVPGPSSLEPMWTLSLPLRSRKFSM